MGFKSTVCSACQKDIQIPTDITSPACPYCGAVQSEGSPSPAPSSPPVATLLGLATTALAAGNAAEALGYYNRVLEVDPRNSEAWSGKGKAAGWQSSITHIRFPEMLVAFNHAIANASDDRKAPTIALAVDEANRLAVTL